MELRKLQVQRPQLGQLVPAVPPARRHAALQLADKDSDRDLLDSSK